MKKIVLLSGDAKSVREIQTWLQELPEETLVETIGDPDEFREKYCTEGEPEEGASAPSSEGPGAAGLAAGSGKVIDLDALGEKSQRHFAISLLILDLESLSRAPLEWIAETRELLTRFEFSKEESPTRVILIGYGESDFDADKFRHESVDDLLLKPLDKSLFLQKAELHLIEGRSVRASFLFKQRTEMTIEMGKDSWVESVSEFGFVIRNPAPLAVGVYARVYSRLFGEGAAAGLIGRVHRAERHPAEPGMYLCHLTFHGITSAQLGHVRKFIRPDKSGQSKPPALPSFGVPRKTAVVIDMNADSRELIADCLRSNFSNVVVKSFPSYSSFLKFCARRMPGVGAPASRGPDHDPDHGPGRGPSHGSGGPAAAEGGDPPEDKPSARLTLAGGSEIAFLIDAATLELVGLDPDPKTGAKLLGVAAEELLERGSAWLSLFDAAEHEVIGEFVAYVRSGQMGQVVASADGGDGIGRVRLRVHGKIERGGESDGVTILRLTLRELSEEEYAQTRGPGADGGLDAIDSIYIDGSLLGDVPGPALDGLAEVLRKARLIESRESLTVTVLGDERSRLRPGDFRLKNVQDFLFKPLDRKMVLAKASLLAKGLVATTDSVDLAYRKADQPGRIAKEVLMEELSEFGLQVRHETPLREQTFLRFFSPAFLERGEGILGRCLYSSKDPDTGLYHCFFSFFGVTDAQLKHIRNWIRGDYASRKEKAGG